MADLTKIIKIDAFNKKFYIFQTPVTIITAPIYASLLSEFNVKHLFCFTSSLDNSKHIFEHRNVTYHELVFDDGSIPNDFILTYWFNFLTDMNNNYDIEFCVAVHCRAGIGRAPLMVTIALIYYGVNYLDAIDIVRSYVKNALNTKQLEYIYKNYKKIKNKNKNINKNKSCFCF